MKIMLDAGHGYTTAGKRSPDGMREYEFNRVVANYAKGLLEDYQNVTVYFAHSDKRDVPLKGRTDEANRLKVDCYVSIHANAYGSNWNDANGIETYVHPVRPKKTTELAKKIHRNLVIATGLKDRGLKEADFHVLRETEMSAVLAECGFMTNREDVKQLRSDTFRKTCAEAIVKGIADHFNLRKKTDAGTSPSKNPAPLPSKKGQYKVQVGAFDDKKNADELVDQLIKRGFPAYILFE
ncbi:N-acetylmuramoyl-L-alanine amidase [Cytobacillus massiliigabonensis]|uniref:N-acetylmuramoyl-L-alanine amidase n=1 Tax=Cytobacillus massiliigabonensis TaxID=1871011 RepID=UPI000C84E981|nr:N-acetylmuramoyl-L-alanine amidase [Cytobacillus massiliigabonensis]